MSVGLKALKKNVSSTTEKASATSFLVPVLYARPNHAKSVKTGLEELSHLSKVHRMTKVVAAADGQFGGENFPGIVGKSTFWFFNHEERGSIAGESEVERDSRKGQQSDGRDAEESPNERNGMAKTKDGPKNVSGAPPMGNNYPLIAIPILAHSGDNNKQDVIDIQDLIQTWISGTSGEKENVTDYSWTRHLVGWGEYFCPLSTAVMGNGSRHDGARPRKDLTPIERAPFLQQCLFNCILESVNKTGLDEATNEYKGRLLDEICRLSPKECPTVEAHALEKLGNDTIFLPPGAFSFTSLSEGMALDDAINEETRLSDSSKMNYLVMKYLRVKDGSDDIAAMLDFQHGMFKNITRRMIVLESKKILRLARKSEIHPDSPIRESQCALLYHDGHPSLTPTDLQTMCRNSSGPTSPGWITIKEHGIRQSFDLTKVMFSRGNVTEKLRFGTECVQSENEEVVLDMYAGIGYYTLPAMILGHAKQVYACEWNANAVVALKHNIQDNGLKCVSYDPTTTATFKDGGTLAVVGGTASTKTGRFVHVFQGDCRLSCQRYGIVDCVDRVSLGLLPSSEGGWKTAVHALRYDKGGWLHVHANVPTVERKSWAIWLCFCLLNHKTKLAGDQQSGDAQWKIICQKVVKVKSFAPRIDHVVADVFMGPMQECREQLGTCTNLDFDDAKETMEKHSILTVDELGSCLQYHDTRPEPPSCALNATGPLHQQWMMDTRSSS